MTEILLPGAEYDRQAFTGSGPHPGGVYTLTWHSTESGPGSIEGARASLHANRAESNILVEPHASARGGRRIIQLVDLGRASKSLRNTAIPGQTNKAGTVQIEVIMRAGDPCADMTADDWIWLGKVGGDISRLVGVPATVPLPFHPYPPEDGHRLGREPWRTLDDSDDGTIRGWVGHQHWTENVHGDPGAWSTPVPRYGGRSPLDLMLEGAGTTPQPKDWFDMATKDDLRDVIREELAEASKEGGPYETDVSKRTRSLVRHLIVGDGGKDKDTVPNRILRALQLRAKG